MTGERHRNRALALAGLLACSVVLACGSRDEPRSSSPEPEDDEESRVWEVLTDPDSIDALCRIAGVSAGGAAEGAGDCDQIVDQCRQVASVLGAFGAVTAPPDVSLEPLLGCPVSARQLDVCLAQVLERGLELYGAEVACGAQALPEVDVATLVLAPGCLAVALRCPELLGAMF